MGHIGTHGTYLEDALKLGQFVADRHCMTQAPVRYDLTQMNDEQITDVIGRIELCAGPKGREDLIIALRELFRVQADVTDHPTLPGVWSVSFELADGIMEMDLAWDGQSPVDPIWKSENARLRRQSINRFKSRRRRAIATGIPMRGVR
jgi:hypothetical protein